MAALSRRSTVALLAAAAAASASPADSSSARGPGWPAGARLGPAAPFSFDRLKAAAAALARRPYRAPEPPAGVQAIDFDAFGRVAYRPACALWADAPGGGGVRFFPLGRYAPLPVRMHVVLGGQARAVLYAPGLFDMPADSPVRGLGPDAGFAGFKVMNADHATDWIAYLGASYFRSADPFNQYGLSARGLALDTACDRPEEFPRFTNYWIEEPPGGDLVVCALLEGPSVTGAFRFSHRRSAAGLTQDVEATAHFRGPVRRLGLAPLTSMYWYGASERTPADDWRPQIHDSDGLSMWTGAGERIWRPLADPPRVIVNAFQDLGPRGYGLMQRDRAFDDYQDDGAHYEKRPSAWVEPVGDWGAGQVQLVEIPTADEIEDNIVAFWTPASPVKAGQSLAYRYRLYWTSEEPVPPGVARVAATWSGRGGRPGQGLATGRRKLVVDFAGASLFGLTRQSGVEPVASANLGRIIDPAAYPVAGRAIWRLMFDLEAPGGRVIDLRAFLRHGGKALTETWIYQLIT